ncbi:MAG: GNAT family N-acetyltransferase, partial [bacterium]
MINKIEIIDPCVSAEWLSFINTHPDAGVFHHPSWLQMLRDVYGYRIFAVCIRTGNEITAGIPFADVRSSILGKRWVSLPFSDHCTPLLPAADPECTTMLMDYLKTRQGVDTPKIEVRWNLDNGQNIFHEEAFVTHLLELRKDPNTVRSTFHKSLVRSLVKAEKEGVVVRQGTTPEDLSKFYDLQVMTRKRLGVPAQPRYFFEGVWKYIIEAGLGYILLAYKDGRAIGGGVYFTFGKTAYYKYGASDFEYRQFRPSHACMWEAIRRSCVEGYEVF